MLGWLKDQFDNGSLMRRIVLFWGMGVTTYALMWTLDFADRNSLSDQAAFIIAAVWAPLNILLGALFSQYTKTRSK